MIATAPEPYSKIYKSDNYGYNWTATPAQAFNWYGITCNNNATLMAAVVNPGGIYLSSDGGLSWIASDAPDQYWINIASDDSGEHMYAVWAEGFAGIYLSEDYGSSWTPSLDAPDDQEFKSITCDSTGKIVVAVATQFGNIFYSTNYGHNWTQSNAPTEYWSSVAMSSSGQHVVATNSGGNGGNIYTSSDGGVSWLPTNAPLKDWYGVTSDSTGRYLTAAASYSNGGIYSSSDYGATWVPSDTNNFYWTAIAGDDSGRYLAVVSAVFDGIYTTDNVGSTYYPTATPSTPPTLVPTAVPSSQPSSQPSTFPTYTPDTFETTVSVVAVTPVAKSIVTNLGSGSVYVTVKLVLSYLSQASGGFITVTAGQDGNVQVVTTACAPVSACSTSGSDAVYCAVNVDVSNVISSDNGGSLHLSAVTNTMDITGVTPQLCNVHGAQNIYFEVDYTVSAFRQPTLQPTVSPTAAPTKSTATVIVNNNSNLVTSNGAPFYVIGCAMAAFAALGVLLVRLHDRNKKLTKLRLLAVCLDLALQGNLIVSEIFYITVLLQSDSKLFEAMAIVLIFARLQNAVTGVYLLYKLYTPSFHCYELLEKEVLLIHTKLHSGVQMLMMLDCAMFRYLPWRATELSFQSMGFPDSQSFKLCMGTRVLQSGIALVVQAVVLNQLNKSDLNDGYTLGLLSLIMGMTIVVFVSICITVGMHLRELSTGPGSGAGTAGRRSTMNNPMHDLELQAMGKYEERIALLERDVEQLKTDQALQRSEHQSLKEEHGAQLNTLMTEIAALKAAKGPSGGKNGGASVNKSTDV